MPDNSSPEINGISLSPGAVVEGMQATREKSAVRKKGAASLRVNIMGTPFGFFEVTPAAPWCECQTLTRTR